MIEADKNEVIRMLIAVTRKAGHALDDSEEIEGDDGRAHVISGQSFDDLCDALDALDELPDDKPGCTMNPADKAEWALRALTVPASAEVPMPDTTDIAGYTPQALRDYGEQCRAAGEAAGYAQGLAEAGRDAERYRWLRDKRRAGELDTHGIYIGVDSPRFVGKWAISGEEADTEIDAALRGEVGSTCKHGIRSPHECKACADEPTDTAIAEWLRGEVKP